MIRTKASLAKNLSGDSSFQVVTFDGSSRKRLPKTEPPKSGNKSDSDSEFERILAMVDRRRKSQRKIKLKRLTNQLEEK